MPLLLATLALAAAPHGDAHLALGAGADGTAGALAGGSVGVRVHPRVRVDLRADAGLLPGWGPGVAARPELRVSVHDPGSAPGRLDLVAGFGVRAAGGIGELGFGGAALELPGLGQTDLRVEMGYLFDTAGLGAAVVSVGPVFDLRRKTADPPPPPPPEPTPPAVVADNGPSSIVTDIEDAEVWFPHPVCRWVPLSEANEMLSSMGATDVQLAAPGRRAMWVRVDGATEIDLEPLAEVGSLVVLAADGDRVRVDGRAVPTSEDGVLMLSAAPGRVPIEVVGNGRREDLDLVVASGMTTWARASEPAPLHVTFPADSAVLSPRGQREIRAIADAIGDAQFRVEGSYSPEGDVERNRELAALRAKAGQVALVEAGVPAERIELVTEPKHIDSEDWRILRAAVITPSGVPE